MRRVLVLGAGGFLGAHTVGALRAAGAEPVAAPARARLDLSTADPADLVDLLHRVRPDAVVNATGRIAGTPAELEAGNPQVLRTLIGALGRVSCGIRLVHLGSVAEYGPQDQRTGRWHEDAPARPLSAYGVAKLAATQLVVQASAAGTVDGVVLRVANPVGAGQPVASLVGSVIAQLRGPGTQVRTGSLAARRDIVSAGDVARAVAAAALLPGPFADPVINIGTGRSRPLREVVDAVLAQAGGDRRVVEGESAGSARSADVLDAAPDVRRAQDLLGWVAQDDLLAAARDALSGAGLLPAAA